MEKEDKIEKEIRRRWDKLERTKRAKGEQSTTPSTSQLERESSTLPLPPRKARHHLLEPSTVRTVRLAHLR